MNSSGLGQLQPRTATSCCISSQLATEIASRHVLRYASYSYDPESGLYYLSARSYDPKTRQFLSKDLSRNDGEKSAYQYCLGNPVRYVDPTGYYWAPSTTAQNRLWVKFWQTYYVEMVKARLRSEVARLKREAAIREANLRSSLRRHGEPVPSKPQGSISAVFPAPGEVMPRDVV